MSGFYLYADNAHVWMEHFTIRVRVGKQKSWKSVQAAVKAFVKDAIVPKDAKRVYLHLKLIV